MGKRVIAIINGEKFTFDTCELAGKELGIDKSTVGKICNGKAPQYAGLELKWADPTSKTIHHGNQRGVTCMNTGEPFAGMYEVTQRYDVSQKDVRDACNNLTPLKGNIYVCYTKDRHKYMDIFLEYLRKATAVQEEANKPAKVKVKPKWVVHHNTNALAI